MVRPISLLCGKWGRSDDQPGVGIQTKTLIWWAGSSGGDGSGESGVGCGGVWFASLEESLELLEE